MQNSSARASVDVGSVIAGTYTIEALIGRGGMGAVFLASHNRLPGKKVAIKVLHAEMDGEEVLARFHREAKIASLLSHPNIVHIEDYNITSEGMPFVVLEYLQGESLAQRIRKGPLSLDQTFSVIRQVSSALAAAHGKNIVHRDLKPANIFLVPSEIDGMQREIAKVLDFGISKMRDGSTVKTQDSALLGTPQYMAPEQATGQHDKVDGRTDIFALGAIVYEMLSGTPAFSGQTIPEVVFKVVYEAPAELSTRVPNLPENVLVAVKTAMSKEAADRYPTVSAFVEALTGSPVSLMRVAKPPAPEVGFAAGSNPKDALAQTMPSQSGAFSTAAGIAQTMPSQNRPPAPQPDRTVADEIGTAGTVPAMPAARGKRLTLAIAAVLVIAGVVIGVVVMSGNRKHGHKQIAQSATAPPAPTAAPTPAPPPSPTPLPAPPAAEPPTPPTPAPPVAEPTSVASAEKPAAKTEPSKKKEATKGAAAQPPPGPPPGDEPESAGENAARLKAAEAALKAQHWQEVESNANAVIASEDARPKQRMRARMMHGIVKCHSNDEEAAKIDLRQLVGVPVMRTQLINACHKAGYFDAVR